MSVETYQIQLDEAAQNLKQSMESAIALGKKLKLQKEESFIYLHQMLMHLVERNETTKEEVDFLSSLNQLAVDVVQLKSEIDHTSNTLSVLERQWEEVVKPKLESGQ